MTTDRCCHGLPMATWCDSCAADFTLRTGPDPVAWTWTRKERRMNPAAIIIGAVFVAVLVMLAFERWEARR